MRPERIWETSRLRAKPAVIEDAQVIFDDYARDPAVAKYMTWTPHRSVEETRDFLRQCERAWQDGPVFPWTLWHKENDAFVGIIEARFRATDMDLGYALARPWWRLGLMSEAVIALTGWALAQPQIYRVWAVCDVENTASARLLERVGMEREGVLRRWLVHPNMGQTPRDCLCYSKVKTA